MDGRRIQEHFYNLHKDDVVSRFFHEKTSFLSDEIQVVSEVDYINDLTIIALVGEFGFGKVVAVGEYLIEPAQNIAEVAFSASRELPGKRAWQDPDAKARRGGPGKRYFGNRRLHGAYQPGDDPAV